MLLILHKRIFQISLLCVGIASLFALVFVGRHVWAMGPVSFIIPVEKCGDGLQMGKEECDDGNLADNDGCNPSCKVEPDASCVWKQGGKTVCTRCGNGRIEKGEECDTAGVLFSDGITNYACSLCRLNVVGGWSCKGQPSVCTRCGDAVVNGREQCDDGPADAASENRTNGDGCDNTCKVEKGWKCAGVQPSVCKRCGDKVIQGDEGCDDGNAFSNDGCSRLCKVEASASCTKVCDGVSCYSTCKVLCGNGAIDSTEKCDDLNKMGRDGCSKLCKIEQGWKCTGAPSTCTKVKK